MFSRTRTRLRLGWILGGILLAAPLALAQEDRGDERARARPEEDEPLTLGLQLTPALLNSLLDKAAERLAKDYHFDEYQHEQMRQLLHERVPKFLRQHQSQLQGVLNEWLEAVAAEQPPDAEYAAEWAQRTLPMVEEFQGLVGGMAKGMREFMTDDQQVLLDGYLAVIDTGTRAANNRLQVFAHGGFDPERDWPGYRHVRRRSPEEILELRHDMEYARAEAVERSRQARSQGGAAAVPPSDAELVADALASPPRPGPGPDKKVKNDKDEWTRYVEQFIRRYQFNDEQKQKAYSFLQQQLDRRERYLLRKGREIEHIKKLYDGAKTDKELQLAESAYKRLNEPIDTMFQQLKEKLDTLPTRAQLRAAALSDQKVPKQRKAAPAGGAGERRPQ
ncbi:MAG: hypothetical protein ACE5I3_10470 [Phycisphaerae bacterium]